MSVGNSKTKAAFLSICSNTVLIVLKLTVGLASNSVSIISEAIHSFTDFLAAIIAFFSVKKSAEPADSDHQYGHGKYEDMSGLLEGALILFAAGYIIYESVEKLIDGKIEQIDTFAGIAVMLISVIANILISSHLFKIAKQTDSMALLADAEHLRTDVYTSLGVLIGLILIKLTNIHILDPIVAVLVALLIIKAGLDLCITSAKNLLDSSLPELDVNTINETVQKYIPEDVIEMKLLKTRKSGADRLVEFTIAIPKSLTIAEGHNLCDRIEADLKGKLKNVKTMIHIEPCSNECSKCDLELLCEDS